MKSTGEVMGIDGRFRRRPSSSRSSAAASSCRDGGTLFVSVKDSDKPMIVPPVRALLELGFQVIATGGTADYLAAQGIEVERVNKVAQGRPHIVDRIKDGEVAMIFNTTEGWQSHKDSASIRASALMAKVPYFTTAARAPRWCGRSRRSASTALKFARCRTIIPLPERDPEQSDRDRGGLSSRGRSKRFLTKGE